MIYNDMNTTHYGGVWGYKAYESNRQIQLKASRAFLGVPKQTPISGILSEMNWPEPRSRTQVQMLRHFHRLQKMDNQRLMKKVFLWDRTLNDTGQVFTWSSEIKDILCRNNMGQFYNVPNFALKSVVKSLKDSLFVKDQTTWQSQCRDLPKLRTFLLFKDFKLESPHIYKPLSFMQKKFMSKFRLGMLQLHIETGRYSRPRLPPEERFCYCNNNEVEDERHFLLTCNKYNQYRQTLFNRIPDFQYFMTLNLAEKFNFLVNDPAMVKQTAKYIIDAFEYRSTQL